MKYADKTSKKNIHIFLMKENRINLKQNKWLR